MQAKYAFFGNRQAGPWALFRPTSHAVPEIGKTLFVLGCVIAAAGLVLWSGVGRGWIGRLPGDFHFRRGGTEVYFPVATCILVSVVLTVISWLMRRR